MKLISVTKNKFAIVDDDNYEELNKYHWHLDSKGYAVRWSPRNHYKRHQIYMHRIINNTPSNLQTDHIDRNKLNNQKNNLRSVTQSINNFNREAKGFGYHKHSGKWRAYAQLNYKHIHLGLFGSKEEAIMARKIWTTHTIS